MEPHFTPSYRPWQQRIAFIPEGDLFQGMRSGKASVETDEIDRFTERHPAQVGQGARGRHHRDGDRLPPVVMGDIPSRWTASRSTSPTR
jgi:cation diffusion facilitator CzcD-associated flavoprotein CzcO